MLSALRVEWLRLIHDWHLVPRLLKAVAERSKDAWLSEEEVHILREVLVSFLRSRMDISKAHKRVKVAPKERRFSLFAVMEPGGRRRWVVYNTCHFGCS